MDYLFLFALVVIAVVAFGFGLRSGLARVAGAQARTPPAPAGLPPPSSVAEIAERVRVDVGHPRRLLSDPLFLAGVRLLARDDLKPAELAGLADPAGTNPPQACMALELLRQRGADEETGLQLLADVGRVRVELQYFYLRALPEMLPGRALVGDVLFAVAAQWNSDAIQRFARLHEVLREFVAARVEAG